MNPLRIATQGLLGSPLSIATQGFQPIDSVIPPFIPSGGGGRIRRSDRLLRDDEEILLMIAGAIAAGMLQ